MFVHISRAEEVRKECDIHHAHSIKTNSAISLSRKPGLDLCCDLIQHSQGLPRTGSVYIIMRTSILLVSLKLSFTWNVTRSNSRILRMAFFAQFCFILFYMKQYRKPQYHACLTPPSVRVIKYPSAEWSLTTSSL